MKNPSQRVGIFVDVQNLYYSARALYEKKVNFGEILRIGTADRQLVRAIAYTVRAESPEEQTFFDALAKQGYEVKSKELQTFVNGQKKGDWDVGMTVDILKMSPKLDAIVLCSGDGDFEQLLYHAKAEGCRAEVISFGRSTSAKLKEEADDFIDLDGLTDSILLEHRPAPKKPATETPQTQPSQANKNKKRKYLNFLN
ncbi:NYN domain-containing protein [Patescibacteria group bacterium]|nr:NYN domain-containing protein [Patescibacteria group bacterium]